MTITVKVGAVPGNIQELSVDVGTTISEVLNLAGLNTSGYSLSLNGTTTSSTNKTVDEGDRILLTKAIKGN